MVVVADAPAREETVVVSAQDAFLADWAVVRARRRVVLTLGAVAVAGLVDHRQSHSPTRGIRGQQQPVAGECVEEEKGHVAHDKVVLGGSWEHDGGDVDDAVKVGHGDHYHSERHSHGVHRGTR